MDVRETHRVAGRASTGGTRAPRTPGTRVFVTNDLGRFLPDGNLEHLGRADRVVKIRGLRVDLSEAEAAPRATTVPSGAQPFRNAARVACSCLWKNRSRAAL